MMVPAYVEGQMLYVYTAYLHSPLGARQAPIQLCKIIEVLRGVVGTGYRVELFTAGALQSLDPGAWLRFGTVGFWVLVVSLSALRGGAWPKLLAYLGIIVALVYWLAVVGEVAQTQSLIAILAGVGGVVLLPIWYFWLGLRLLRNAD